MKNNEPTITGDTNIGMAYRLMLLLNVPAKYQTIYMAIARYSVGYCRATTNVPSTIGYNRNSQTWANSLGISKGKFLTAIKELVQLKVLKVHRGSQYMTNGGSFPDYYSLVFNAELQSKHHIFFNLNRDSVAITRNSTDYFITNDGSIHKLLDSNGKGSAEWKAHLHANPGADPIYPTIEQLTTL